MTVSPSVLYVVEWGEGIAAAYCGKLFAGLGAEVIKVEPSGGDPLRGREPYFQAQPGPERSIPFLWLNTGKKSVVLDSRTAEGRLTLDQLLQRADVFITDLLPTVLTEQRLTADDLRRAHPRLATVAISPFGQAGPYRDYLAEDLVAYAMSGLMYLTGDPTREPLVARPSVTQYLAGMHAFLAALLALWQRAATGKGQFVDLSVQESALENIEWALANHLQGGPLARRSNDNHTAVPWQTHPCRDGLVAVVGGPVRHWLAAAPLFGQPQLLEAKYRHLAGRMQHRSEVWALLAPWLMQHDKRDIYHAGQQRRLAFGYVASLAEVLTSPQLNARQFFVEVAHPVVGTHRFPSAPFRPSAIPWRDQRAPLLGEHSAAVFASLADCASLSSVGPDEGKPSSPPARPEQALPLEGMRIVDFTHDWAGPHATRLLADFGAEVIRVEHAGGLDMFRGGLKDKQEYNRHTRWHQMNRNKRSVVLDLKQPANVAILHDLIRTSHAVVASSRPGVMERLGAGYETLRLVKPDLVYLLMSAFGASGPEAAYGGYGAALEALSGIQVLTGYDAQSKPMRLKELDVINGTLGACALMTGLLHQQRTGQGQFIDLSQLEAGIHGLIGEFLLEQVMNASQPLPRGNRNTSLAPQGCYRCQGDDKWIVLSIRTEQEWRRFCTAIGQAELVNEPRFATQAARRQHHDELDEIIQCWTSRYSHLEAMHHLQGAGIAAGAVLNLAELSQDPHLIAREYFLTDTNDGGKRYPGVPFRCEGRQPSIRRRGPDLAEAQEYVLCELLGRPRTEVVLPSPEQIRTAFDID